MSELVDSVLRGYLDLALVLTTHVLHLDRQLVEQLRLHPLAPCVLDQVHVTNQRLPGLAVKSHRARLLHLQVLEDHRLQVFYSGFKVGGHRSQIVRFSLFKFLAVSGRLVELVPNQSLHNFFFGLLFFSAFGLLLLAVVLGFIRLAQLLFFKLSRICN